MDLPRPAVPGRRRGWNHPAGWAGMVEAGLALVLLVIEVAAQLHNGNLLHLAVAIALPTALDEATTLLAHHGHTLAITTTPGDPLPPPVSDLAARIVREGTHNIVRHAPAHTTAELAIDRTPTTLDLILTNPCTPGTTATPGTGLSGIIRRVEAHGGTCTITTHDNHWTLAAHLPAH